MLPYLNLRHLNAVRTTNPDTWTMCPTQQFRAAGLQGPSAKNPPNGSQSIRADSSYRPEKSRDNSRPRCRSHDFHSAHSNPGFHLSFTRIIISSFDCNLRLLSQHHTTFPSSLAHVTTLTNPTNQQDQRKNLDRHRVQTAHIHDMLTCYPDHSSHSPVMIWLPRY